MILITIIRAINRCCLNYHNLVKYLYHTIIMIVSRGHCLLILEDSNYSIFIPNFLQAYKTNILFWRILEA